MNYYNENDRNAAAWLRELIADGLIPPGEVDDRSILEVQPADLRGFTQCHFFSGIGGWSRALDLARWPSDREVWTGSCPCQPFSSAGKGMGEKDARHLWPEFYRLVRECRPAAILGEQTNSPLGRGWLNGVFADCEQLGYAVAGADISAACIGAPHIRQRLYWVANAAHNGCSRRNASDGSVERRDTRSTEPSDGRDVRGESVGRSASGGLADARHGKHGRSPERRPLGVDEAERQQETVQLERCGCNRGLDYAQCARLERQRGHESDGNESRWDGENADRSVAATCRGNCRMVNAHGARPEPRQSATAPDGYGSSVIPTGSDFWADSEFIPCADGKARRIERGLLPLAHGIPAGVGCGGDPSLAEVKATAEARVMRLKGYGNAIVPPLAAEFIAAFLETE